jgi:hypothetical protein
MNAKQAAEAIERMRVFLKERKRMGGTWFIEEMETLLAIAERAGDVDGIEKAQLELCEVGERDAVAVSRWLLNGEGKYTV